MKHSTSDTYPTLRAWRKAARLNQREAATLLKVSASQYSKWERGVCPTTGPRAKAVSAKTGVPVEILVGAA